MKAGACYVRVLKPTYTVPVMEYRKLHDSLVCIVHIQTCQVIDPDDMLLQAHEWISQHVSQHASKPFTDHPYECNLQCEENYG